MSFFVGFIVLACADVIETSSLHQCTLVCHLALLDCALLVLILRRFGLLIVDLWTALRPLNRARIGVREDWLIILILNLVEYFCSIMTLPLDARDAKLVTQRRLLVAEEQTD